MYWRDYRLSEPIQMNANTTHRIELPECGEISGIRLDFRMVNAAAIQDEVAQRLAQHLTRIAVVTEDQEVLFSMTGDQLRALNFYQEGYVLSETANLINAESQLTTMFIPFGRYKGDRQYGLDMERYCQLYLEISNDLDAARLDGNQLSVLVEMLTVGGAHRKFLQMIKHYQHTREKPSSNGQELVYELPGIEPIKSVMVQMIPELDEENNWVTNPWSDSNRIKLMLDMDKERIIDSRPKDVARENGIIYGRPQTEMMAHTSATWYMDTLLGYVEGWVDNTLDDGSGGPQALMNANTQDRFVHTIYGGYSEMLNLKVFARGVGYWNTLMLWDSLSPNTNDLLKLDCIAERCKPAHVKWIQQNKEHTFAMVISSVHSLRNERRK